MHEEMRLLCKNHLRAIYQDTKHDKLSRDKATFKLMHKSIKELSENYPSFEHSVFNEAFSKLSRSLMADMMIDNGVRVDGRKKDDLRNIGKGIFNRELRSRGSSRYFVVVVVKVFKDFENF
jgi:polyribonucleotide nucleotidyltransferase